MAGYDPEEERAWNEYEWERFLQQQDKRTEQYMELLERYVDHPQRDEIIAREMGWAHLDVDDDEEDFELEVDDDFEPDAETLKDATCFDAFKDNALYQAAFSLTMFIDRLFDNDDALQHQAAAVTLATQAAMASAKLAAAVAQDEDDCDEIGMRIAYLKRGLKAITVAIDASAELQRRKLITADQHGALQARLFQVRDGIISLMGQYRGEWLRRFGSL